MDFEEPKFHLKDIMRHVIWKLVFGLVTLIIMFALALLGVHPWLALLLAVAILFCIPSTREILDREWSFKEFRRKGKKRR